MVGEEKRHQMMQNLFGDQSEEEEEEEEEEEIDSEHESSPQPPPGYASDEGLRGRGRGNEAKIEVEGQGEADHGESEGNPQEIGPAESYHKEHSDDDDDDDGAGKQTDSEEENEEYDQRKTLVTSRRNVAAVQSDSERSDKHAFVDGDDQEVNQVGRYLFVVYTCVCMNWPLQLQITVYHALWRAAKSPTMQPERF